MKREAFIKSSLVGIGSIFALPQILAGCCNKDEDDHLDPSSCVESPVEIKGPFPILSPADLVKSNIIGNRTGVPLVINIIVQNINENCMPIANVKVDIWQCDAKGNYSEYNNQLEGDFTSDHFLRGRQITNDLGQVTFVSIYPGWYPGRAPHLHLEVKNNLNQSLLVTQIAFPENVSSTVYTSSSYNGNFDTSNTSDGAFSTGLEHNIVDSISGDLVSGYTISKIVKVAF